MSDDFSEKRLHPRHSLRRQVRIESDGEVIVGETADISLGGVSVDTDIPIGNDAFVHMHIETVGEVTGHVVRSDDNGLAIKFDPVQEERKRLEDYLKSMFEKEE